MECRREGRKEPTQQKKSFSLSTDEHEDGQPAMARQIPKSLAPNLSKILEASF
jgi:hypothetical protein